LHASRQLIIVNAKFRTGEFDSLMMKKKLYICKNEIKLWKTSYVKLMFSNRVAKHHCLLSLFLSLIIKKNKRTNKKNIKTTTEFKELRRRSYKPFWCPCWIRTMLIVDNYMLSRNFKFQGRVSVRPYWPLSPSLHVTLW